MNILDKLLGKIQKVPRTEQTIHVLGKVNADDTRLQEREREATALPHADEESALEAETELARKRRDLEQTKGGEETLSEQKDITVWSAVLNILRLLVRLFRA